MLRIVEAKKEERDIMMLISDYTEVPEESTDFCLSEFSSCTNIEVDRD